MSKARGIPSSWERRLREDGRCLSPGCEGMAATAHERRWCTGHGDLLKRVRAELDTPEAKGLRLPPKPPAPVIVRQVKVQAPGQAQAPQAALEAAPAPGPADTSGRQTPRADGMCVEGCGREAAPNMARCRRCSPGRRVAVCAVPACTGPAREGSPHCYRHRSRDGKTIPQ